MKWMIKALLLKTFDFIPKGDVLYYSLKALKYDGAGAEALSNEIEVAALQMREFLSFWKADSEHLKGIRLLEFGGGYDLHKAFLRAAMGVGTQVIVDINPLFRSKYAMVALRYLIEKRDEILRLHKLVLDDSFFDSAALVLSRKSGLDELLSRFHINYRAPFDMRIDSGENGLFDLIVNASVLEHVPAKDIPPILHRCMRILKSDGCLFCSINLGDHYSGWDSGIGAYNFLKFSDAVWENVFNSKIHYQNRLRCCDYRELFTKAGFTVVSSRMFPGADTDSTGPVRLKLARRFREAYSRDDILVCFMHTLLCKKQDGL
jgi:SAM-dependent methyltransferase